MIKTLALSAWFVFHPVHVSLTSIDHVRGTDSLKVFIRMYYDDFLLDFALSGMKYEIDQVNNENTFPCTLMNDYLEEKVNITVNNKRLTGKLSDLDLVDNEISMNVLYMTDKKLRTLTVRNLIMTDLYADQANMTIIRINGFEEGVKLTPEKVEQSYTLR